MISAAVKSGSSILIASTTESTVEPTKSKSFNESVLRKRILEIENIVFSEACVAIKNREKSLHDALVLEKIKHLEKRYDVIIFTRASMAHLEGSVKQLCDSVVAVVQGCVLPVFLKC